MKRASENEGTGSSAPRSSADRATLDCLLEAPAAGEEPCLDDEGVWIVRAAGDRVGDREPLLRLVGPSLALEGPGDQEPLARLVRQISHLREHGVCVSRLALGRLVVLGQHLDENRHVGAVGLLMVEAEVVHDRAGLCDRRARGVELAGEPLEPSDSHQAARLDEPARVARRLVEDRAAAGERGLHGLGPPERDRGDVPGDEESEPFISCLVGVRESALVQVSGFEPGSRQHPEETESVRRVAMISRLLEVGHQRLELTCGAEGARFRPSSGSERTRGRAGLGAGRAIGRSGRPGQRSARGAPLPR